MSRVRLLTIPGFLGLICSHVYAGAIPVLNISLSADVPTSGVEEIAITDETGPTNGCGAYYAACDNLALTNWTLTVSYTSSYYNGDGPSLASPYSLQWQSSTDDVTPAAPLTVDLDLCGSESVSDCSSPTTTITEIDFSGTLDQSSFTIYDPNANGGAGGPGPTFFSDPNFSLVFTPSSSFPADYYESQDGLVSQQTSVIPEPTTSLLVLCGFASLFGLRRRAA